LQTLKLLRHLSKAIRTRKRPQTNKYQPAISENLLELNGLSALATRNWTNASFEGAEKNNAEYLNDHYVKKTVGCATCGMSCDRIAVVPDGPLRMLWRSLTLTAY
jgi:aldehyde:ferredoxin oxidoreductase